MSPEKWIDQIGERMRDGASLGMVEDEIIDPAPLSQDQKAALWVFAWSSMPPSQQQVGASLLVQGAFD